MKLFGFRIPFTEKLTDANTVTPITAAPTIPTRWGWIVEAFGGAWQSGMVLDNERNVLAFAAVYSCLSLISKDVGKLRPKLMEKRGQIWVEIDRPANPVLTKPNRFQTRNQFYEHWMLSKLIAGNTYVLKQRNQQKLVEALYILDPRTVMPRVAPDGEVFYQLGTDNLSGIEEDRFVVPSSEIIHDRHTCLWHPLVGVGPLYACGISATQGRRIQSNSARFFENMSRPSGQLTAAGTIDDITAERLKKQFEENFSGHNIGRLLVAGDGLKFEPFAIPADQAQLVEQLGWTVEDVARAFGVPLYKIGAGEVPSFANVGALNLEYYEQTLQPHIEGIESLLDDGLDHGPGLGVEFDLEGLLRMDPKTRAETREIEVRSATLTPNEGRAAENRPPLEGGATAYLQQQNFSLAALAKRDASNDPFGKGAPAAPSADPATSGGAKSEETARALHEIMKGLEACYPNS